MNRIYKLIVSIIALGLSSLCAFAQEEIKAEVKEQIVEYKDVFLDGKPAKLNVATGEIKLVNPEDKKVTKPAAVDTYEQPRNSSAYIVNSSDFHIVKENESLLDLSQKYGVTLNQLKAANNLDSTLINEGQTLRVSNFDAVADNTSNSVTETNDTHTSENYKDYSNSDSPNSYRDPTSNYHIVSSGETLFSLARHYGLSVSELKNLNNLNSNLIRTNQRLRVNSSATSVSNENYWVVQSGDNLYRIALNNGTTVNSIKRLNGLTSNLITVGQKLKLR